MIYNLNKITFDGCLLKQRFAYDFYKNDYKPTGVVVIFNGPVKISYDLFHFMKEYPSFDDSINICWEIPNLTSCGNIFFKKLFLLRIKEELQKTNLYKNVQLDKNDSIFITYDNDKTKEINLCILKQPETDFSMGFIGLNMKYLGFNVKEREDFCKSVNDVFYELTVGSFLDKIKTL
jgi:hypothetical protein